MKVNESFSEARKVSCSVPQGSILGPLLFVIYINDIPLTNSTNISYSALFADDLGVIFTFKKPGKIKKMIKGYLDSLVAWLYKWRLKINAKKSCFTVYNKGGRNGVDFDFRVNGERIPYSPNPIFLGIIFDEYLSFNHHFSKLRERALKRLNLIRIFSHSSWHLSKKTLIDLYKTLVGSIFDYSFFTISSVSESSLKMIQTVQNRAIRCIYRLKWDSPTNNLPQISGLIPIKWRLTQLGIRFLVKAIKFNNPLTVLLISEYIRSLTAIKSRKLMPTPLCFFLTLIAVYFAFLAIYFFLEK